MNKVTSSNKIDELCHRLYLTDDFQDKLAKTRSLCGIPFEGFKTISKWRDWSQNSENRKQRDYLQLISKLWITRKKLPPDARFLIQAYVLFGSASELRGKFMNETMPTDMLEACAIDINNTSEYWEKSGVPFIKLIISERASQRDIRQFISSNWDVIQLLLINQSKGRSQKSIRPLKNKAVQEEILRLSRLNLKDLRKIAPNRAGKYAYKEDAIVAIIQETTGVKLTSENVRTIISRRKK